MKRNKLRLRNKNDDVAFSFAEIILYLIFLLLFAILYGYDRASHKTENFPVEEQR